MAETTDSSTSSTPLRMSTHEGLGPDIVVSSPSTPRRSIYLNSSPAAIKRQLEEKLNEKSNQIQMTAELGQALVKQKTELEQRIQELDQTQGDEVPQELKDKLAELEKQAKALEDKSTKVFPGAHSSDRIDASGSTGSPGPSATSMTDSTPAPTRLSRRELNKQKNRKTDVEFAADIGQGLLLEVRRLQALLQEKEERIKELELEKSELERNMDTLNRQLRAKEESEERYKEENWNLELTRQELSAQLDDLQQQLDRARNDYSKMQKALAAATDVIEQLKDKEDKLTTDYLNLKTRHDQDMANNRRHVAALNREKNDLQKNLSELKDQFDSLQASRNIRKRTPEPGAGPNDVYVDEFGQPISIDNDNSGVAGIPAALQGKNLNIEVETLKALGVANRMIGSLRANVQKEKSEKYELKKLLADSQEQIEAMRYETELVDPTASNKRSKKSKISKRSSSASNGLPNIDENEPFDDSQDEYIGEDSEDMVINKDNRPSSDMFRPRGWKPDLLKKSRDSGRSSIMSSRIDEDIPGGEEEEMDDDEIVAQRNQALTKLDRNSSLSSKSPRVSVMSKKFLVEEPESPDLTSDDHAHNLKNRESVVRRRISEYEDIANKHTSSDLSQLIHGRKSGKYRIINLDTGEEFEEEIRGDDASSVDSFTSAPENNLDSKRGSSSSKRESKRESTKEFKHASVQTDDVSEVERSDSLSTVHTGKFTFGNRDTVYGNAARDSKDELNARQSVLSVPEDNNIDKRFTLDLSSAASGHQKNLRKNANNVDGSSHPRGILQPYNDPSGPPSRPTTSPPPTLMAHAHRPITVNFGQQAGTSKIPSHPSNIGRKRSTDSQDFILINNASGSRSIGNGVFPPQHKHTHSSGSASSVSSASTSAENVRSDSSHVEAGSSTGPMTGPSGTDPSIIRAITQTMIGEYLYKYHRSNFGTGKRHKRFFWVHPYTKTLYWSVKDPGHNEPMGPKSKSGTSYFAYIESVKQVVDHNPSPPGIHYESLVIKTPERELKFTASSKERHDYWFQALSYLLQRPDEVGQIGQSQTPGKTRGVTDPWENQANMQNLHSNTSPSGSLKGSNVRDREIRKKSSFNKIQSIFRRDGSASSPTSPLSTELDGQHISGPSNSNIDDDELEDLENVRQCCDGRHDVSKLERANKHHHHHNHNHHNNNHNFF